MRCDAQEGWSGTLTEPGDWSRKNGLELVSYADLNARSCLECPWLIGSGIGRSSVSSEGEKERGSLFRGGLGPNPASVFENDSVNGGKSNASPGEVGISVQSLKRAKKFLRVLHAEPSAVVTDEVSRAVVALLGSEFDLGSNLGGEFPSIAEQIFKRDPHESSVGIDKDFIFDSKFHFSFRLVARKFLKHRMCYSGKVDVLLTQISTTQA